MHRNTQFGLIHVANSKPIFPFSTALCETFFVVGIEFEKRSRCFILFCISYCLWFNYLPTATPADVSLLLQLGVDGVFVGSGIFKSSNPAKRAVAMAHAVTHYKNPQILSELSSDLGEAMFGIPNKDISRQNNSEQAIWNATLGKRETF